MLTNSDINELTAFRRDLHRWPEISGEEIDTAKRIVDMLAPLQPSQILTGLGGHGVAAVFQGVEDGPTVLVRCELDALPIQDIGAVEWQSQVPGKGHLCGHDGHMAIVLALGRLIARRQVAQGRVVLMFQPAEEDGSGAVAVTADPLYAQIAPDWAFAIHNEPGRAFGLAATRAGLVNCASQGLEIRLHGKTAHAAEPEAGVSPQQAIVDLLPALSALGTGGVLDTDFRLATVTHVRMGEPTFGISPGEAVINVTFRAATDAALSDMVTRAQSLAKTAAQKARLTCSTVSRDIFAASINDADATRVAQAAMDAIGVPHTEEGLPMRASEDFGVFGWQAKSAMVFLGSGKNHAALHNPDYDFPDNLIPIGAAIFDQILRDFLGSAPAPLSDL